MPRVRFRSPLQELEVEVEPGTTILDAAGACDAQVGHTCGGVCGCSTCHVWVKKGFESLAEQEDKEIDRLDHAFDVRPFSRLACQTQVDDEDLEVWITQESLEAFMDENPQVRKKLEAEGKWPPPRFS